MAEVADEIAAMAQETTEQEDEQEPPAWPRFDATHRTEFEIKDAESLRAWLDTQGREVAVAFAARAALRSVPAIAYRPANEISNLACIVFRATAMALIAVKFPTSNDELRATARAAAEATRAVEGAGAAGAAIDTVLDADAATAALRAAEIAASEVSALAYNNTVKTGGDSSAAVAAGKAARDFFWGEIFADATSTALASPSEGPTDLSGRLDDRLRRTPPGLCSYRRCRTTRVGKFGSIGTSSVSAGARWQGIRTRFCERAEGRMGQGSGGGQRMDQGASVSSG